MKKDIAKRKELWYDFLYKGKGYIAMEGYVKKINHRVITKHDKNGQKRIKRLYLWVGIPILTVGAAGFLASMIAFLVLFFYFQTDQAMAAWISAVPFFALLVSGAVVTRIGDMLLKDFVEDEYEQDQENKRELKRQLQEKKEEKAERKRRKKDI